jgi:hypothetical protein
VAWKRKKFKIKAAAFYLLAAFNRLVNKALRRVKVRHVQFRQRKSPVKRLRLDLRSFGARLFGLAGPNLAERLFLKPRGAANMVCVRVRANDSLYADFSE